MGALQDETPAAGPYSGRSAVVSHTEALRGNSADSARPFSRPKFIAPISAICAQLHSLVIVKCYHGIKPTSIKIYSLSALRYPNTIFCSTSGRETKILSKEMEKHRFSAILLGALFQENSHAARFQMISVEREVDHRLPHHPPLLPCFPD